MNAFRRITFSISPYFWLLAALIGFVNTGDFAATLLWMAIIVVSVLVHEFGHAVTALAFGQQARIQLVAFGGVTTRTGPKLRLWQEFLIVLDGPLFGLALCLGSWALLEYGPNVPKLLEYVLGITAVVNFFWSVFNLIPVVPMDGGKLLSLLLEGVMGARGIKISLWISMVLAMILGIYFMLLRAVLVSAVFFILAFESYRSWRESRVMTDKDRDPSLQDLLRQAQEDLTMSRREEAAEKLEKIRTVTVKGLLYRQATMLLAALRAEEGRSSEAYQLLMPLQGYLEGHTLDLLQHVAYNVGDWPTVVDIGNRLFQGQPELETAFLNALACGMLGKARAAVGWLETVRRTTGKGLEEIVQRPEFDPVRNDPLFQQLLMKLR